MLLTRESPVYQKLMKAVDQDRLEEQRSKDQKPDGRIQLAELVEGPTDVDEILESLDDISAKLSDLVEANPKAHDEGEVTGILAQINAKISELVTVSADPAKEALQLTAESIDNGLKELYTATSRMGSAKSPYVQGTAMVLNLLLTGLMVLVVIIFAISMTSKVNGLATEVGQISADVDGILATEVVTSKALAHIDEGVWSDKNPVAAKTESVIGRLDKLYDLVVSLDLTP